MEHQEINKTASVFQEEIATVELITSWLPMAIFYIVPIELGLAIFVFTYGMFFCLGLKSKRITPLCALLFSLSVVTSFLYCLRRDIIFYVPRIIYGSLTAVSLGLLILKKPFTVFYSGGKGLKKTHYIVSAIWIVVFLICFLSSIFMFTSLFFIYVSVLLPFVGFLLTMLFNFGYLGKKIVRERCFRIDKYTIVEVKTKQEEDKFYSLLSAEIWKTIYSTSDKFKTVNEFKKCLMNADENYRKNMFRFLCLSDNSVVGTICCVLDRDGYLPIERDMGIDLTTVRRRYKIMEVGHFSVDEKYRNNFAVLLALFKAVIEVGFENDVDIIVSSSYEQYVLLYEKLGFLRMNSVAISDKVVGSNIYGLSLNLSNLVVYYEVATNRHSYISKIKAMLNPYLAERYYKRQILFNLFRHVKTYNVSLIEFSNATFAKV